MGLFGSLFTGVSALFAQSQNTAIISNNIANVNTTGYKRSEASFQSLVTTQSRSSRYSPGTVSVNRTQRVDQQGSIQQTASTTDASISGNGFFPVKRSTQSGQEFLYTRAGQFSEDASGLLRNASGFVLYAWPLDTDGNLPSNQGDLTSLVPADVAFLGGLTRPTTTAELAINLNADQQQLNSGDADGFNEIGLPIDGTVTPPHFSRGLTVYDELGSAQTITLEYRKVTGPMANITSDNSSTIDNTTQQIAGNGTVNAGAFTGIAAGDSFDITVGADTLNIVFSDGAPGPGQVQSFQDLVAAIDGFTNGAGARLLDASINSNGKLVIKALNPADTFTIEDQVGTPASGAFNFGPNAVNGTGLDVDPQAGIFTGGLYPTNNQTNPDSEFPQFGNVTNPNTEGWWELKVIHPDGSTLSEGLLNFRGDGTLNAARDGDGNIDIELQDVDWGNGSSLQDFRIDIERLSQFAGNYDVIFSDQNGAELGLRTGVEITREGKVVARFSNGASADLYQIPLITFANQNGLNEVSGTAYTENEESGEENLREAGTGGAGFVEPSTLEASNVDLADEFARLIVAQRAFGAGTRTINTVDQMTQDLLSLR